MRQRVQLLQEHQLQTPRITHFHQYITTQDAPFGNVQSFEVGTQCGDLLERGSQDLKIARIAASLSQSSDSSLNIPDSLQRLPHLPEQVRLPEQVPDHLLSGQEL